MLYYSISSHRKSISLCSSETSVLAKGTQRNVPEDGILHGQRHENLKSYTWSNFFNSLNLILWDKLHQIYLYLYSFLYYPVHSSCTWIPSWSNWSILLYLNSFLVQLVDSSCAWIPSLISLEAPETKHQEPRIRGVRHRRKLLTARALGNVLTCWLAMTRRNTSQYVIPQLTFISMFLSRVG
jgi:hypothetical protein